MGLMMRMTRTGDRLTCIALVDHDGDVVAEVFEDDPLFGRMRHLLKMFAKAIQGAREVTFMTAGGGPGKTWLTDTSASDAVWRKALDLVYAERIGS